MEEATSLEDVRDGCQGTMRLSWERVEDSGGMVTFGFRW
jgi:hypothetical protein